MRDAAPKTRERKSDLSSVILAMAAVASFFDRTVRRRERLPADVGAVALPQDRAEIPAFDEAAAGSRSGRGPRGIVLRFAERRGWRWAGRALQVQQRFADVRGNELAASVTLVAFLSLFPLLLVGIAVVGFLQANSSDFAGRAIDSLGLHGEAARQFRTALNTAAQSRKATSVVGVLGLIWASLGFTSALRLAFNTAWQVPDRGARDKAVGLVWLAGAGLLFAAGALMTATARFLPSLGRPVALVVGLLVAFGLFLWTSRILPNVDVGWRPLMPGAVFGAVGLLALQIVGAYVVPRTVASASALYGTLGIVFAILAWLVFFGRLIVYVAVLDVVLYEAHAGTVISVVEVPRHRGATRTATRSGTTRPSPTTGEDELRAPVALVRRS